MLPHVLTICMAFAAPDFCTTLAEPKWSFCDAEDPKNGRGGRRGQRREADHCQQSLFERTTAWSLNERCRCSAARIRSCERFLSKLRQKKQKESHVRLLLSRLHYSHHLQCYISLSLPAPEIMYNTTSGARGWQENILVKSTINWLKLRQ